MRRFFLATLILGLIAHSAAAVSVGDAAPDISAATWFNADRAVSLASLKGKVAVVEFWATWCPPCRASIPHLVELQNKYQDEVVVIGLTYENAATVKPFANQMKMSYIVGAGSPSGDDYGVSGIPHAVVIDRNGTVAWEGHPLSGLDQAVAALVAGKTAAVPSTLQLAASKAAF
jgi:thiol-disulfide isomerase/thioredoxin